MLEGGKNGSGLYGAHPLVHDHDIRLLKVQQVTGKIVCELKVVSLNTKPRYRALSYTWGPSRPEDVGRLTSERTHLVICDGHDILVTENLYLCLHRLARRPSIAKEYLWVDLLCVNQRDECEKTSQVKLMASIYHSAENVLAWLGEEDSTTSKAFQLIERLGQYCDDCLHEITPRQLGTDALSDMLGTSNDVSSWRAIQKLFQHIYFSRVWIIQEIMLAKDIEVLCGSHTAKWRHVSKVSKMLTITSWTRWICPQGPLPLDGQHASYHGIPNLLRANNDTRRDKNADLLLYSLIRARRFASTDPRDKVYALLGIASEFVSGKPRYDPIYGRRTMQEAFIQTSIQLLLDSDHLLLLSCAEGDTFHPFPALPSWVPDWSCNHVVGLGVTGYERFSAAGAIPRTLRIDDKTNPNHPRLAVRGFRLDTITETGECKHEVLHGAAFPRWLSLFRRLPETYNPTSQPRQDVFWRTLFTDTAGSRRSHPAPDAYGAGFAAWIAEKLSAQHANSFSVANDDVTIFCSAFNLNTLISDPSASHTSSSGTHATMNVQAPPLSPASSISADDYETAFSHSPHLRPFITRQRRYFGVGSESLRCDDQIWIIAGSRVPLVLRSCCDSTNLLEGTYRIVGGAYVHGLMNGDALKLGLEFEDLTII